MKNKDKIQKNQIRSLARMLTNDVKLFAMAKNIFLKTISDFHRQVKNSESWGERNDGIH